MYIILFIYEGKVCAIGAPASIFSIFSKCFRAFLTLTRVAAEANDDKEIKNGWMDRWAIGWIDNLRIVGSDIMTMT